ncbi:MAG: S53 family peptidase [Isosphaeraceae bacterium]
MPKPRRALRPSCDRLDDRWLPSGLDVAQLTQAYGLGAIAFPSPSGTPIVGNGSGETIALVEAYHDPTLVLDLHVFDQANGLADPSLSVVDLAGTTSNPDWTSEEALDAEWAHAIAPGASILVVEAQSDSISDLMKAVSVARSTPGVVAVSMSWGFGETSAERSYDPLFLTPTGQQGITFIAASGDNGTTAGPEYPASSPNVLAVGGTTLLVNSAGGYLGEVAWSGSEGGYSAAEPEPAYQRSIQRSGRRSTPDVAFNGDPNTGVEVYETPPGSASGMWMTVGGTSLGAPAWAAIIAIVDQGRALHGKGSLDGATQTLPALYQLPPADFHAITTPLPSSPWGGGVNPIGYNPYGGAFHHRVRLMGRGVPQHPLRANISTGLGSPVAPRLIADLVASSAAEPLAPTPARALFPRSRWKGRLASRPLILARSHVAAGALLIAHREPAGVSALPARGPAC